MKFINFLVFILSLLLINTHLLSSQTTKEFFTRDGLSINAYHYNQYDGDSPRAFTYHQQYTICDTIEIVEFINNVNGTPLQLLIDEGKVYRISNCDYRYLIYDFDLEVGDTINEGMHMGYVLTEKYPVILLNGEERMRFDITHHQYNFLTFSWIEGIGDISNGLVPIPDFEGGDIFVCAKQGDELLWQNESQIELCDSLNCLRPIVSVDLQQDSFLLQIENSSLFGTSYDWDFGDGNSSTESTPQHEYEQAGCYPVSLTISNECFEGNHRFLRNIPVCLGDPWVTDYEIDTFTYLRVRQYSEHLEFAFDYRNPVMYITTDNGINWTQAHIPVPSGNIHRFINDVKMFDDLRGVMVCGHYSAQGEIEAILITQDGGLTWEEKAPNSYFIQNVETSNNGKAWAMGPSSKYFRSLDFGHTWERITYPDFFTPVSIQYINDTLLFGTSSTTLVPWGNHPKIMKSNDNGLTWDTISPPPNVKKWHFFNSNVGYAVKEWTGMAKTIDGGLTWEDIELDFAVKFFSFYDENNGWLVDNTNLVHYTTDGMETLTFSNCGGPNINYIQASSESEAFIVSGTPENRNFGKSKKTFDLNSAVIPCFIDADNDGFSTNDDCDDTNSAINPNALDIPDNGIDEDCNGEDLVTTVYEIADTKLILYPNPSKGHIYLKFDKAIHFQATIFDFKGKQLKSTTNTDEIDFSDLVNGIYLLEILDLDRQQRFMKKIVLLK